jgi:hypothetical protein
MTLARIRVVRATALLTFLLAGVGSAQQPVPNSPPKPSVQAKIDVVLSRFLGEKKISSLPFTLLVEVPPDGHRGQGSIRMGIDVPIGAKTTTTTASNPSRNETVTNVPKTTTEYKNIGTWIDCGIQHMQDWFEVNVGVQDSSIYTPDSSGRGTPRITDPLAFRSMSFNNQLPMRDGQTLQFAMATDKISGETVKVDVTLSIVK